MLRSRRETFVQRGEGAVPVSWMQRIRPGGRAVIAALLALFAALPSSAAEVPDLSLREGPVWVIPIEGTIDLGLAAFVARAAEEARAGRASLVLVEVNTFGGRLDAATEIRDRLLGSGLPTAAFVTDRAWSAGALISLAADTLWMAPGSSIGAAQPVPSDEKSLSAVRAEFESMAERTGRDPRIAAAMVDASVVVEGLSGPGELLTLSAERARQVGYAEGIASTREAVIASLGLAGREVVVARPNWGERAARFLTGPEVSQILLSLAFLGLLAEAYSPGLIYPGAIGLLSLFLFFAGRTVVGLVGLEVVLLLLVGFALLLVELFVVPGFGVFGAGGIAAILAAIYLSFAASENALVSLGVASGAAIVGAAVLWRIGRRARFWDRLVLKTRQENASGYVAPADFTPFQGRRGRALTPLRPSGIVEIGGERIDAVSEGGFVEPGTGVVVVKVEGTRVIVREVETE